MTFPLPSKGHVTSYGIGLFQTDSHFGFEVDTPGMLLGDGKKFYIDIAPVPSKLKEKGIIDADAIGVYTLMTEDDDFLCRGEVLDSNIFHSNLGDEEDSYLLLTFEGVKVNIVWDTKAKYHITEDGRL